MKLSRIWQLMYCEGSWPGSVGVEEEGRSLVFPVSDLGVWWCCLLKTGTRRTETVYGEDDLFSFGLLSLCVCVLSRWKFIVSVWEEDVDVIGFQPTGGT